MTNLVLASLFLPLSHFLIASTSPRGVLVHRFGERAYSRGYSVLAFAAFVWLIVAYCHAPASPLWQTPQWLRVALTAFLLLSSTLIVAGVTTPNPVIVRSGHLFERSNVVRGVLRISRNSFFWGVSAFAISHVIIIGDDAALLAFGSVAILGLAGAPILDGKKARTYGADWQSFAAVTSDIPFLAITQGRQRLALGEIGWWRISIGVLVFLVTLPFHRTLFGEDVVAVILAHLRS